LKELDINRIKVFDYDNENAQALIFIHAFPMNSKMWDEQVEYFKGKFRVLTYDVRGFGQSEREEGNYTIDSHADDLLDITGNLGIENPVICSLSMGGYIALRIMEKAQDKLKAAILCDTKSEADTNEAKLKRAQQIKQIKSGGRDAFVSSFIENALSTKSLNESTKKIPTRVHEIINEQNNFSICGGLMSLASRTDTTPYLEKINIPVLVIVGEDDKLTPVENAQSLNRQIPGSKLVMINSAGHFTNIEKPSIFNETVKNFLESF
jgi:pimeloyl-ACP methyl ester carboxylesterase